MFNYIKYIYFYLYNMLFGLSSATDKKLKVNKEIDSKMETETEYIERNLTNWKVKMYSDNSYLTYIPDKRILLETSRLRKEYYVK